MKIITVEDQPPCIVNLTQDCRWRFTLYSDVFAQVMMPQNEIVNFYFDSTTSIIKMIITLPADTRGVIFSKEKFNLDCCHFFPSLPKTLSLMCRKIIVENSIFYPSHLQKVVQEPPIVYQVVIVYKNGTECDVTYSMHLGVSTMCLDRFKTACGHVTQPHLK